MTNKDSCAFHGVNDIRENGLTKREYFAIKALQGILSNETLRYSCREHPNRIYEKAAQMADNLINELNK